MKRTVASLAVLALLGIQSAYAAQCNTFSDETTCDAVDGCFWNDNRCTCASDVSMDVFYSMDSSGSIGYNDFQVEKQWVVEMIASTLPQNSRVAFDRFASSAVTLMDFVESESYTNQGLQDFASAIAYTGGGTNTAASLDHAISMFQLQSNSQISKVLVLITDGNPTVGDLNICSRAPTLKSMGVTTVIIGVGSSWDPTKVDCLVTDSKYVIYVNDYSYSAINTIMPAITDVTCPVEYKFILTEVMLEKDTNGDGATFVEIYNKGDEVTLRDVELAGIFEGVITTDDTLTLDQSQYLVLYDTDSSDLPSCQDCPCTQTSNMCNNAVYIPCCTSGGCSCWFAGSGMTNENWDQTFIDSTNTNEIDQVQYDSSTWTSIFNGYSYELKYTGYDNDIGDNWKGSCNDRGTPGDAPINNCTWTCTDEQCQQNGASSAVCNGNDDACLCSDTTYYFSDRTCKKVPKPGACTAYWMKNDTNAQRWVKFVWDKAQTDSEANYSLQYFRDDGATDKTETTSRSKRVIDFDYSRGAAADAGYVRTVIDNSKSDPVTCYSVTMAPTHSPTPSPSQSPTPAPTFAPTPAPTHDYPRFWISGDLCQEERCECYDSDWDCVGENITRTFAGDDEKEQFISVRKWPGDYPWLLEVTWEVELIEEQYDYQEGGDENDQGDDENTERRRMFDFREKHRETLAKTLKLNKDSIKFENTNSFGLKDMTGKRGSARVLAAVSTTEDPLPGFTTTESYDSFGISPQKGSLYFNGTEIEKIAIRIRKYENIVDSNDRYRLYKLVLKECMNTGYHQCRLLYPSSFYLVVDITGGESLTSTSKEKEMPTWLWYLIAALVIFLAILAWLVYKYWWKNRETTKQLVETEDELGLAIEENELGFGRDLGVGDVKFNPIATGVPDTTKAPMMGDKYLEDRKHSAVAERADVAVEKFAHRKEMGQAMTSKKRPTGAGLSEPLLG